MFVEVIQQTVSKKDLEAIQEKAKENKQSIIDTDLTLILIRQDIEKIKKQIKESK